MSALTDLFTAFANKIRSKTGGSDTYTPPQMVNAIDDVYQAGVDAGTTPTQTKTVTAGTTTTTVTPDTGYALSSVTVNPTPSQSKSATPSTTAQTITPDSGKLLSSVSVSAIQTQTKSTTPSTTAQTITPDSGKYLTSVSVGAISTQTKSVTPSTTSQTVTPDSGKYLTSVSVGAISTETKTQAAGTSNIDVTPTSGKYLTKVTITPQQHSATYTPAANTSANNMGASHNYRYVNTSGMIVPSGNKSITANGTGIDVSSYATASVAVPDPTLSGTAAKADVLSGATFYNTSTTKQTGTMTNNEAVSKTLAADDRTYTVPAGYHNGSGSVTVPAVTATKRVGSTSTSVDVASDDWTVTLNCGDRLYLSKGVIADGYSQGAVSANSLASQTGVDSGKTAIDASHVHSGYQGWVNGSKVSGTYTPPTITSLAPSDSNPPALETTKNYNPTSGGYAIKNSPTELTPNDSDPPTIASGVIYKGGGAGFAVATKPTKTETTLWTNSSPTSNFAAKDVTGLSAGIDTFDYIRITYRASTSDSTSQTTTFAASELPSSTGRTTIGMMVGNSTRFRPLYKSSNTSIYFYASYTPSSTSSSNTYAIPTKIEGIKYTGI